MAYLDEEGLKHTWGKIKTYIGGTIDNEMSDTSINSVQNKVVKAYVDDNISALTEAEINTILADI